MTLLRVALPFHTTTIRRACVPTSFARHISNSFHGLKVSQDRLWYDSPLNNLKISRERGEHNKPINYADKSARETIHSTCEMAGVKDGGLRRLSCDDNDKIARDWFANEVRQLGCKYEVDAMGSQWATIEGENNTLPPIGVGSHLDSVQSGGKFDGPLGVFTGLEVLKVLKESGKKTYAPFSVINWTNEEGARFPPGCMSSAVWAHKLDLDYAHKCYDTSDHSVTIGDELKRIGYNGSKEVSYKTNPLSAHFEIHIEQGSRLEKSGKDVGVADSVQGMRWFDVSLRGVTRHTDTTPMEIRKDALVGAAKIVLEVQRIGQASKTGMATVSLSKSSPQNFCNIPSEVDLSFSMQHTNLSVLTEMTQSIEAFVYDTAKQDGLEVVNYKNIWSFDPSEFDKEAIACIESAAKDMGYTYDKLCSHTGHDSIYTNMVVPTAMVFTPCRDGISHSPLEYASPENCSVGAQTILGAVLRYDDLLRKKHSV